MRKMTTAVERPFDSFLIVGLTTTTSPPATLSSTFSAVNQPSSAENGATSKIIPENGFEFDSLGSSSSYVADVTSSILYHYPTGGDADPSASSSSINPKSLCDFCFPDLGSFRSKKAGKKWKIKRETFSFVLTDTKGGKVLPFSLPLHNSKNEAIALRSCPPPSFLFGANENSFG